jgi:hypothetical protein
MGRLMHAAQIYDHVTEPFIGLMKETPDPILGKTQRVIFAKEFGGVLFGPGGSWWRDNEAEFGVFAKEVGSTTLGKVINANTNAQVSDDVFHV